MKEKTQKWTTKDGKKIRICEMEDLHLSNAIAMMEKKTNVVIQEAISSGYNLLDTISGEIAIYTIEDEIDNLMLEGIVPQEIHELYHTLINEKERRKAMSEQSNVKTFFIAGVQFHQMKTVLNEMSVGDNLLLVPEPTNRFDPNAVQIIYARHDKEVMCGFVPKKFSAEVSAWFEAGLKLECVILTLDIKAPTYEQCMVEIREIDNTEETGPDIGDGPDYDSGSKER